MHLSTVDFIAGWFAGLSSLLVSHPIETIKVREQAYGTSIYKTIGQTYRFEGFTGFYKGLLCPLITIGPANSIFFGIYGNVLRSLQPEGAPLHPTELSDVATIRNIALAGCSAGFVQVMVSNPIELVKIVLQASVDEHGSWKKDAPHYTGNLDALRGILKKEGIFGLYRGVSAMLLRDVPASAIYLCTYEMLLHLKFSECERTPPVIKQLIAGGCAGLTSWTISLPMDVVKSQLQVDNPVKSEYRGLIHCIGKLYRNYGIKVFFRGLETTIIMSFLKNAFMFVGYETVILFLK